jgi:hypothetical protein
LSLPQLGFISAVLRLAALSPLSLAACGTLIGLDDLERECTDACPDGQVEPGGATSGSAPVEQGGGGAQMTGGGTLGVAGGGTLGVAGGVAPSSGAGGMRSGDTGGTANETPYAYGGAGAGAGTGAGTAAAGGSGGNGDVGGGGRGGGTDGGGTPSGGGSTGGLPIRINFQLLGAPVPAGYVPDTGLEFAAQDGLSFGWSVDHTDVTRDREVNSNQLLDTLCQFHEGGVWELALPNGTYSVLVSVGDARLRSTYTLVVEGVTYWEERVIGANQFESHTSDISIADGRLTLDQGTAGELATRINYIEVSKF